MLRPPNYLRVPVLYLLVEHFDLHCSTVSGILRYHKSNTWHYVSIIAVKAILFENAGENGRILFKKLPSQIRW
jgi:hypothetical protein